MQKLFRIEEEGLPGPVVVGSGANFSSVPVAKIEGPFWVVNTPEQAPTTSEIPHMSSFGKHVFATVIIMVISHEVKRWASQR